MSETEKPKLSLKTLQAEIEDLRTQMADLNASKGDVKAVAGILHDLTKLLMQDHTAPALTAHRGKWKKVLADLDVITKQEEADDQDTEGQDQGSD